MEKSLQLDLTQLEELLSAALQEGLHYLDQINELPTSIDIKETTEVNMELSGMGGLQTLEEFKSRFKALMVASTGTYDIGDL